MSANADKELEPYQPFFLSGILISTLGVLIWFLFQIGWLKFYPQEAHAYLMIGGFLLAYISGFLMTAIPRMTGTNSASVIEISTGLAFLWAQVAFVLRNQMTMAKISVLLLLINLVSYLIRRFLRRSSLPPKAFVFIPIGIISAIVGLGIQIANEYVAGVPASLLEWSKLAIYQGLALNLILGLGSRLIPALTRVHGSVDVRAAMSERVIDFIPPMLLFNAGFIVESFWSVGIGNLMKGLVVVYFAFTKFAIFKPMVRNGNLGWSIRASVVFMSLGFFLTALLPEQRLHLMHLTYIGGMGLLTILISTRVTLAHGGHDLEAEFDTKNLVFLCVCAAASAIARASIGFFGDTRQLLIFIAGGLWLAGLFLWSQSFLKKLLK